MTVRVVFEGPDGSGKSTLIKDIKAMLESDGFSVKVIEGEGPERYPGEINERLSRWFSLHSEFTEDVILYDRHPCVSQPIYSYFKDNGTRVKPEYLKEFERWNFIKVYCCRSKDPGHVEKPHDTPEHLEMIEENKVKIGNMYEEWAFRNANFFFDRDKPQEVQERLKSKLLNLIKPAKKIGE